MQGRRLDRLNSQIQEEVCEIISRRLKDPRIGFVTLTGVKASADMSYATIYVSILGSPQEVEKSMGCLEGAAPFIRSELGKRLHVRRIPEVRFRIDDSSVKGARIDLLLKELKESKDDPGLRENG
jgi:ribosome-binding factor A